MSARYNSYDLETMTIVELSSYYNIVKTMIDSCLFKLKLQLPREERERINTKRLKYNQVLDYVEAELNNRIDKICSENEKDI
jgi:hypothetical protein